MRRSRFVAQVFSDVTFADASTISAPIFTMSTRAPVNFLSYSLVLSLPLRCFGYWNIICFLRSSTEVPEDEDEAEVGEVSPIVRTMMTREEISSLLEILIFNQFMTPISDSGMVNLIDNISLRLISGSNHRSIRITNFDLRRRHEVSGNNSVNLISFRLIKTTRLALPLRSIKTRCPGRLHSRAFVNGHGQNLQITVNGNMPKRHRLLAPKSLLFYRIIYWRITLQMITGEVFTFTYRGIC
jgi:hypothetical protein